MPYCFHTTIPGDFDEAVARTTAALKEAGFGVLTTIDIKDKLKEKLNVDFRRYLILGACHPPSAYEALKVERRIGTMLPCNVVVQETDDGRVEVAAIDPEAAMQAVGNPALTTIAAEVSQRLRRALNHLE